MKNTEILIVEDDMIIASDISVHLSRSGYEIMGIATRGEDAIEQIKRHQPDIILMDVNLKGDLNGIETTLQVQEFFPNIIIIFLTANSDEATYNEAKKTKPHAFISKPFKKINLERAIELALLNQQNQQVANLPSNTNSELTALKESGESYILSDRIFVRNKEKMIKIFIADILYAEAERNYCKVFTAEKEYLLTLPLKAFEEKLGANNFTRVHRSYIINLTKVDELSDNCSYVTIGQHTLPVSKSYKEELINRLKMI